MPTRREFLELSGVALAGMAASNGNAQAPQLPVRTMAEAAARLSKKQLSPVELTQAVLGAGRRAEPEDRRVHHGGSVGGHGCGAHCRARDPAGTISRASPRNPVRGQGHVLHEGHSHDSRVSCPERFRSGVRLHDRRSPEERWRDSDWKVESPRVLVWRVYAWLP